MTSDPTARRKAMADELQAIAAAMRKQHDIEFSKMPWDSSVYWLELARAAKEAQLNYGNAGPRIYIVGGVAVTDGTTTMEAADVAAQKQRKEST